MLFCRAGLEPPPGPYLQILYDFRFCRAGLETPPRPLFTLPAVQVLACTILIFCVWDGWQPTMTTEARTWPGSPLDVFDPDVLSVLFAVGATLSVCDVFLVGAVCAAALGLAGALRPPAPQWRPPAPDRSSPSNWNLDETLFFLWELSLKLEIW